MDLGEPSEPCIRWELDPAGKVVIFLGGRGEGMSLPNNNDNNYCFTAIMQVNLR